MESSNYNQGDLADIVRASGGAIGSNTSTAASDWQFPTVSYSSGGGQIEQVRLRADGFGHPFSVMGDPLLGEDIDTPVPEPEGFFPTSPEEGFPGNGVLSVANNTTSTSILDERNRPASSRNIFISRMQISPGPVAGSTSPVVLPSDSPPVGLMKLGPVLDHGISHNSFEGCLVESPAVQISSPRNTGIKRRKSQAKKVVCIPAPAPANSRASGEVVPSDLWAWRKYGQKPIKGSPYPRGYYRCSSSKGCSARKQVERSRTDPNMLVITYTSEHNHPWPTQRNALAGSIRSQIQKNSGGSSTTCEAIKEKETSAENVSVDGNYSTMSDRPSVKEEENGQEFSNINQTESAAGNGGEELINDQSYKPELMMVDGGEDLFADLDEAGPLDLLFTQGDYGEEHIKGLMNPFTTFFGWNTSGGNINNHKSSGEAKRDST